jgi:hypothetical protein
MITLLSPGQGFTGHALPLRRKPKVGPLFLHYRVPLSLAWSLPSPPANGELRAADRGSLVMSLAVDEGVEDSQGLPWGSTEEHT